MEALYINAMMWELLCTRGLMVWRWTSDPTIAGSSPVGCGVTFSFSRDLSVGPPSAIFCWDGKLTFRFKRFQLNANFMIPPCESLPWSFHWTFN